MSEKEQDSPAVMERSRFLSQWACKSSPQCLQVCPLHNHLFWL
ncbi:MAG: hypothetical protein V7L29_17155 [Nostoc sp.]